MATPFDGLVNLKPVDNGTTFIVNDLTGLEPAMIDSLKRVNSLETPGELWVRIKNNAYERLLLDFEVLMAEKRDFMHEMSETQPLLPDPKLPFGSYLNWTGVLIKAGYSKLTAFHLNSLIVWAEADGTADIVLYNRLLRKEIQRLTTQALTAGFNTLNLTFAPQKLELYGMELFVGLKTNVKMRPMKSNLGWQGPVCDVAAVTACFVDDTFADEAFVESSWTWPVHLVAKIKGDIDELATNNKIVLASAFRYLCGHLLLVERLSTQNFNEFSNVLMLRMEELRDDFHTQYKSQLTKAVKIIYPSLDNSSAVDLNIDHQGGWFNGSYI
ncbi:hypothetical protein [Runella sp.]|uniref:hypothetical protein n=1 Tax=Runella sp. TaxID=1960881 RepID=UPI003D122D63